MTRYTGNGSIILPTPHSQAMQAAGFGSREASLIRKPQGNLKGSWMPEAGACEWTPPPGSGLALQEMEARPIFSSSGQYQGSLSVWISHPCGRSEGYEFEQLRAFMNGGGKGVQRVENGQNKQIAVALSHKCSHC